MSRIAKTAADVTHIPTASHNNAASAASASRDASNGDGERRTKPETEDKWIFFNPELAELLGGMDGIICAVLTYGIYTWLKTPAKPFGYNPTIDGRKAAYRSTRELMSEYSIDNNPLWDDTTILNALNRTGKKKCGLTLDTSKKQFHFSMSDKLLKMHKSTKGFLAFRLSDAIRYGVLEAILLANLDHQMSHFKDLLTDNGGNKYAELSATKLTNKEHVDLNFKKGRILPVSKDAVDDALANLRNRDVLVQHPVRKSFYCRKSAWNGAKQGEAKISSGEAKISSRGAKISSGNATNIPKCRSNNGLQQIAESLDSNSDGNSDRKCLEKNNLASLIVLTEASLLSNNGKKEVMHELIGHKEITHEKLGHEEIAHELMEHELMEHEQLGHDESTDDVFSHGVFNHEETTHEKIPRPLINPLLDTLDIEGEASDVGCDISAGGLILLDTLKHTPLFDIYAFHPLTPTSPHAVYEVIDYDKVEFIGYETPYDFIPLDWNTGKPYCRNAEIDYSIKDIKWLLRSYGIAYKASEIEQMRQLFIDHPLLTFDHVRTLLQWCKPRVEPLYIGNWSAPKKGHDSLYWGRRIRTFTALLKYLPDIIKEWYRNEMMEEYPEMQDEEGEQIEVDYSYMADPFLSIAFADEPLLLKTYQRFQASDLGKPKMGVVCQHLELVMA